MEAPHHRHAERVAVLAARDWVATIAPLLVQPIAPADVGTLLAEVATGDALNARIEIAGPDTQHFVDMARRTLAARGEHLKLVPTWRGAFDTTMAGEVLLPAQAPASTHHVRVLTRCERSLDVRQVPQPTGGVGLVPRRRYRRVVYNRRELVIPGAGPVKRWS